MEAQGKSTGEFALGLASLLRSTSPGLDLAVEAEAALTIVADVILMWKRAHTAKE